METVGIVTEDNIELSHWLGVADRRILRLAPELKSVLLDIGHDRIVGVVEGRQPMVRVFSSKPDALGRSFGQDTE